MNPREGVGLLLGLAVGGVFGAGLMTVIAINRPAMPDQPAARSAEELPAGESPANDALPAEDAAPVAEEVAPAVDDPNASAVAAIRQAVEVQRRTADALNDGLQLAHEQSRDARRELSRLTSAANHLSATLTGISRNIPHTREQHTAAVMRLIEAANAREERWTADQLWRELGQFDVSIAHMEGQVASWSPMTEEVLAAMRQWSATVADWSDELAGLRQTRSERLLELANLELLTSWDSRLDEIPAELARIESRLGEIQQALDGLRPELEARQATLDSAEQFTKAWDAFQDQWRAYLLAH